MDYRIMNVSPQYIKSPLEFEKKNVVCSQQKIWLEWEEVRHFDVLWMCRKSLGKKF